MHNFKRYQIAISSILLTFFFLMPSCGGSSSTDSTASSTTGPVNIELGSSLASATQKWVSTGCNVQVMLTSDGGFRSAVTSSGVTFNSNGTWAASTANTTGLLVTGNTANFWVSTLNNISGTTASSSFTADVFVTDISVQLTLNTCTFTLQTGTIP